MAPLENPFAAPAASPPALSAICHARATPCWGRRFKVAGISWHASSNSGHSFGTALHAILGCIDHSCDAFAWLPGRTPSRCAVFHRGPQGQLRRSDAPFSLRQTVGCAVKYCVVSVRPVQKLAVNRWRLKTPIECQRRYLPCCQRGVRKVRNDPPVE